MEYGNKLLQRKCCPILTLGEEIGDILIYSYFLRDSRDRTSRDHYEGSLTTPVIVQWFVLREQPIQVPALYFGQLREIQD